MSSPPKASAAIVVSGVLEILGSAMAVFGIAISFVALSVLPATPSSPQLPPAFKGMVQVVSLLFLAVAVLGIVTGVSLIRLRNWARIATLIWAGFTALISGLVVLVFLFVPIPVAPNQPPQIEQFTRIAVLLLYGIPLGIGVWWLILFNKKSIAAQFAPSQVQLTSTSIPQGEPFLGPGGIPAIDRPSCPLPVAVIAGFSMLSAVSFVFIYFMHTPVMLFGRSIHGPTSTVIWILTSSLYVASGVGLLKLKPWSYSLALGLQLFWLCSGTVSMLSSNFENVLRESLSASPWTSSQVFSSEYVHSLRFFAYVGLVFPLVILGILVYYRPRFLEAADAASTS
jgi:hypothetical protein